MTVGWRGLGRWILKLFESRYKCTRSRCCKTLNILLGCGKSVEAWRSSVYGLGILACWTEGIWLKWTVNEGLPHEADAFLNLAVVCVLLNVHTASCFWFWPLTLTVFYWKHCQNQKAFNKLKHQREGIRCKIKVKPTELHVIFTDSVFLSSVDKMIHE